MAPAPMANRSPYCVGLPRSSVSVVDDPILKPRFMATYDAIPGDDGTHPVIWTLQDAKELDDATD